jgi:hypothetical protein
MRSDMIGPRRLQPAKTEDTCNPIFVLVNEDPHRVLKSQVMPGVTEGQMNGALPRIPSTRPGLYLEEKVEKAQVVEKDFDSGESQEVEAALRSKPVGIPHLGIDRPGTRAEAEKKKKRMLVGPVIKKAKIHSAHSSLTEAELEKHPIGTVLRIHRPGRRPQTLTREDYQHHMTGKTHWRHNSGDRMSHMGVERQLGEMGYKVIGKD